MTGVQTCALPIYPHEFFADKKHGGKKKAEQAAKAYYKELDLSMPPPMSTKNLMNKRNNSGKVGVHISVNVDRRQTKEYVYWCWTSQWIDKEETRKSKTFSWIRYGDELAHELACIARDNETQDMEKIKKAYM